jgi:glycosyltransferase involved in cell wall biosynthesis
MIKVLHVINGLNLGGAEVVLQSLVANEDRARFQSETFSLIGDGEIARQMREQGLVTLNCDRPSGIFQSLRSLIGHVRRTRPDVIQGWMYNGNIATTIAAKLGGVRANGWGIHHSIPDLANEKKSTQRSIRLGIKLSKQPRWILYSSRRSSEQHAALGYEPSNTVVIPSGYDTDAIKPDPILRAEMRRKFDLGSDDVVIGMIGRYNPQKDWPSFIDAAGKVAKVHPNVKFVGIGRDVAWSNETVSSQVEKLGLKASFRLLGEQPHAGRFACMFDINVLSSAFGEAFPSVVAEGMACAVPTVGTDVGDIPLIIGEGGRVTPPSNPAALAEAIVELLDMPPPEFAALSKAARDRIIREFSMKCYTDRYADLYGRHLADV